MTRVVGGYELHDPLGEGGHAIVFLARKKGVLGFSPIVAVKCLRAPSEMREALAHEALTTMRVRHANVVQTLDVVQEEGELVLVLELVVGISLAKLLRRVRENGERMPPPIAAAVVAGLLRGLEAAHDARDERNVPLGLVHRDVSPENVLVDEHGTPKLADFGVARVKDGNGTSPDALKGKLSYMAPEILRGQPFDARVDVHAAGVVLFEALTGAGAFDGHEQVVINAILDADIPPPSSLADVPEALDDVVRRSVTATPEERFASAAEMRRALEAAIPLATASEVAAFVTTHASFDVLRLRESMSAIAREATDVDMPIVSRDGEPTRVVPKKKAEARWLVPVLVASAVVMIAGIWLATRATPPPPTPRPEAPAATSTATPSSSAPPAIITPTAPATTAAAPGTSPARHRTRPSRACQPPWTIDERGIKHYKDECL